MKLLTQYIIALSNLYGLVSAKQILEIYNSQNEQKISLSELNENLEKIADELNKHFIYIDNKLFVHEAVLIEEDNPYEIYSERSRWPYYIPEKEELLKYLDDHYFEKNELFIELQAFLKEKVTDGDAECAEEIGTEIHDHLLDNFNDISGALNIVTNFGLSFKDDETKGQLGLLVGDYAITIRVWEQNGFSLLEMNNKLRIKSNKNTKSIEENFEEASLLEKYIVSLTHLYGRATLETVVEVYNLHNESHITIDEVADYLDNPPTFFEEVLVYVKFGEFISEDLEIFDDVRQELWMAQKDKPLYIPEQEELFSYFDYNYMDYPKEYEKLLDYLTENVYEGDYTQANLRAEDIYLVLQMGDGLEVAMGVFSEDEFIFEDKKLLDRVLKLIKRLNNNTRMRENNGLTPRELSRIEKEQRVQRVNLGRNDPCHCGSGKKYKKCCLKKDRA